MQRSDKEDPEKGYVHPFFSPKPVLPKWRDIPWILFVLGSIWAFQYTPLSKIDMSSRGAAFLLLALVVVLLASAWVVLWTTHKVFPTK